MSSSESETTRESETSFSSSSSSNDGHWMDDENVDDLDDGDGDDDDVDDDVYIRETKRWVKLVPIGLGLCPWAVQSHFYRNIKYRTCYGTTPSEVEDFIFDEEIDSLTTTSSSGKTRTSSTADDDDSAANDTEENIDGDKSDWEIENRRLKTTLVICPNVKVWSNDFEVFDGFVQSLSSRRPKHSDSCELPTSNNSQTENDNKNHCLKCQLPVTFVAFHPLFLRWRGLSEGIRVGSIVETNRRFGLQKSQETFKATIIETPETSKKAMFGLRRVKVRFHDDDKVQYIPNDWVKGLVVADDDYVNGDSNDGDSNDNDGLSSLHCKCSEDNFSTPRDSNVRVSLPDNAMHRSPYPTIHLIRNEDLGILQARDVSRVKRKNAQRMMKLGWGGFEIKMEGV